MLGFGRFRWRTVTGGSRVYVVGDRRAARAGTAARERRCAAIRRDGRRRRAARGRTARCGASTRWSSRRTPTRRSRCSRIRATEERRALGGFAYTVNDTVLHTDSSFLPRARAARASWNYRTGDDGRPTLTYYLNRLQRLEAERDYCVTLNQDVAGGARARAVLVHASALHGRDAARAGRSCGGCRARGTRSMPGAHLGNGFHEDGLASGVAAAAALGVTW